MKMHGWTRAIIYIFAFSSLLGCVEQVVEAPHDCPQTLQAVDLISSEDSERSEPEEENQTGELICIWDTCQSDEECGFNEKCYLAKDYDWGRCFWEEQFGCESDDECNPGTGMVCGQADPNTTSFYVGMGETQCRYGCNDDEDCRLLDGLRCVSSKWDSNWKFCAEGCNTDSDCVSDETPLDRCLEDEQREYKTCKEYCTTNEECVEAKGDGARCSSKNVCLVGNQCVDFAECAIGEYCDSYAGCNSCKVDGDCRGPPYTDGNYCEDGRCIYCREDADCSIDFPVCTENNYCSQCRVNEDCPEFHECNVDRCNFVGCKSDDDCKTISQDRGMGDLEEHMVCVISGGNQYSTGQCKVGCNTSESCEDLRDLLPEWKQNDHRGKPKPNWDSLHGSCAPPCVGGTCMGY